MGCHSLLQEIFPTQGSNPSLLQADSLLSEPPGKPKFPKPWIEAPLAPQPPTNCSSHQMSLHSSHLGQNQVTTFFSPSPTHFSGDCVGKRFLWRALGELRACDCPEGAVQLHARWAGPRNTELQARVRSQAPQVARRQPLCLSGPQFPPLESEDMDRFKSFWGFSVLSFCLFILFMGFSRQEY